MKMNSLMSEMRKRLELVTDWPLHLDLHRILDSDFILQEGCLFLNDLYKSRGNATTTHFSDQTGYEAYVNHIHIDEFAQAGDDILALGFKCMSILGPKWKAFAPLTGRLRVILATNPESCVLRFHGVRAGQIWLSDDLESYTEDAIAIADYDNHT